MQFATNGLEDLATRLGSKRVAARDDRVKRPMGGENYYDW